MLFYQYTGFSAIPQAPEWLPRADNSHIVYVSFLDEETGGAIISSEKIYF